MLSSPFFCSAQLFSQGGSTRQRLLLGFLAVSIAITAGGFSTPGYAQLSQTPDEAEAEAILESDPTLQAPIQAKAVAVDIVSDTLDYDEQTGLYTATGDVKVVVSEQNTELVAKKVTYNPEKELVIAEGDVIITDGPEKVYGTYAKIDLTRESALINDPITVLDKVRIKAREGFKDGKFTKLVDGKLVIPGKQESQRYNQEFDDDLNVDLSKLAVSDPFVTESRSQSDDTGINHNNANQYGNSRVLDELDMRWDEPNAQGSWFTRQFTIHSKEIDVVRHGDYDDINLNWPSMRFGGFKVATLPNMDFARTTEYDDIEYLGPAIGLDPDNGGFYAGPGMDFKLGDGFVRFSPYLSVGSGRRRARSGQDIESVSGFGGGAMVDYMSHRTNLHAGYNFLIGSPTAYFNRKLFDGKTRFVAAANEDYNHGFMGWERPRYIGQLTDERVLVDDFHNFRLKSFVSAGVAHDEFYPTNDEDFFVETPDSKPVTAGRAQAQFQISNQKPLLSFGDTKNNISLGVVAQGGMSAYSTGDFYGVLRGGPRVRIRLFDRFSSNNQYFRAVTMGDSPFVFDTYYSGRNSVQSTNQVRINKYLSLGMRTQLALNSDNARNDMLIGNAVFVLFGPEDIKFNLAYDVVRQRSFFGINFMPGKNRKTIHYDTMNIQDEVDYDGAPPLTPAVTQGTATDAFGNVNDIGMMNGNKAN